MYVYIYIKYMFLYDFYLYIKYLLLYDFYSKKQRIYLFLKGEKDLKDRKEKIHHVYRGAIHVE